MKCPKCGTELKDNSCPACGYSAATATPTNEQKNSRRLLGFRSNKIWKKILSICYLVICGILLLSILGETKYKNLTTYDFVLEQTVSALLVVLMLSPYAFLSNTKFRDKLPLFKKHSVGASAIGMIIIALIIGIASIIVDSAHSDEFLADRKNHAYTEISSVAATCEKSGKIEKLCEYCGNEDTETIPPLGHLMKEVSKKEPTESEDGEIVKECSTCGKQERIILDKLKSETESSRTPTSESKTNTTTVTDTSNSDELIVKEPTVDISLYYGSYYSPTELYGISLWEHDGSAFYLELNYADGKYDEGYVIPGQETTLSNYAMITVNLLDNGSVHVELYSAISADGNFDEDLNQGSLLDAIGLRSAAQLVNMNDEDRFRCLRQIESDCIDLNVNELVRHPDRFCNNIIYRIPGIVTWADNGLFLLDVTNDYENDTIICYSDDYVSEGEEVCVYGTGIGVGTYTKTYYDGVPTNYEFEALELNVGFILKENVFTYDSGIPTYIQDFIYGDYVYKPNMGDPYYMEDYLSIDASTINGREYTVDSAKLTFSYTPDFDNLNGLVCFNLVVSTIDRRGNKVNIGFFFDLDGIECNYTLVKHNEGTISSTEFGFYLRAEPVD